MAMAAAGWPFVESVVAVWIAMVALIGWGHRRQLSILWREPVFRCPVLVLESDDWGAGPHSQAQALRDIVEVLERHRDAVGRMPMLNLALVLAVPDGQAISTDGRYHRVSLDDPRFASVLQALREGEARGVFALQLHGMEHFWPAALMASGDPAVAEWLRQPEPATTEQLPSQLQSRWVDAGELPSSPHPAARIHAAVEEEVRAFERIFGIPPRVVVPPTFVWTREVERAWAAQSLECIVTPGWRYTRRNADGLPGGDEGPIVNGDQSADLNYLVRTDYFEPLRGRDAGHALRALAMGVSEGRPCILENHRDNFIFDTEQCRGSLAELDALCAGALKQHAGLRFLSTLELGRILRACDPQWLVQRWRERLPFVWQRLRHSGRPWKLMRLTGLAALGAMLVRLLGATGSNSQLSMKESKS